MKSDAIAGIDIGGTKTAIALATPGGRVLAVSRFPTRVELGPYRTLDEALEGIEKMAREAHAQVVAGGIGCAGPLDRERGLILSPPNLPGWDEFPVRKIVERHFKVPTLLENDANAAALGEYRYGAGRGFRDVVYLTISTGIGGAVIIGGKLRHGVGDGAGEVGHMVVAAAAADDSTVCGCGGCGCLEAICSGTNIARRARARLREGARSAMTSLAETIDDVTAQTVVAAARGGDAVAAAVWDETIRYLAIGIGNILVTLAPQAVILGGGVATAAGEFLLEPLRREIRRRVTIVPVDKVRLTQAALGGESGIYGALMLGRRAAAAPPRS